MVVHPWFKSCSMVQYCTVHAVVNNTPYSARILSARDCTVCMCSITASPDTEEYHIGPACRLSHALPQRPNNAAGASSQRCAVGETHPPSTHHINPSPRRLSVHQSFYLLLPALHAILPLPSIGRSAVSPSIVRAASQMTTTYRGW